MPVINGCIPEAPDGGHNNQLGTLLGTGPPGDPPAPAAAPEVRDELPVAATLDAERAVAVLAPAETAAPVVGDAVPAAARPDADPAAPVRAPAENVDCTGVVAFAPAAVVAVVFVGVVVAAEGAGLLPRVTTPLLVTLFGFVAVCAAAGIIPAKNTSTA